MAYKPKEKPGTMMYKEHYELFLENFEDGEFRPFIKAMYEYAFNGVIPDFGDSRVLKMAWQKIKKDLDRDHARYEEVREARRLAGQKSGEARQNKG